MKIGRVYKVVHFHSDICYIGSTFQEIERRWKRHKKDFKNGKYDYSISPYYQKYGIENFKIILIKEYKVCDKKHIRAYEQLWINKFKKTCVNMINSVGFCETLQYKKLIKYIHGKEKIQCDRCGSIVSRNHRAAHKRSKKCKRLFNNPKLFIEHYHTIL